MFGPKYGLLKHHSDPFNSFLVVLLINPCGRDVNIPGYPLSIKKFSKMNSTIRCLRAMEIIYYINNITKYYSPMTRIICHVYHSEYT